MKKYRFKSLAVFCASSDGNDPGIYEEAYNVGAFLAGEQIEVVFGGSRLGLMGQVAKGALEQGGEVTGVIPDFLKTKEVVHTDLTNLITTKDMHGRKLKMHDLSDGFIALPGGFGTLEELFEILTWGQLGLHRKPVGILNSTGYYDDLLQLMEKMVNAGLLRKENMNLVLVAGNIADLLQKMQTFEPMPVPKWMNKNQT
ncbi:TIGR00730 family Rossman fold protein [Antarcticibacterium flavum]|uniref:Cytokinin riboside 5'-monophosphate phosphoribohydrolase n=1 Tax=Antarcticibacterium flavum TaxID=2058175 RepID=A0A5B7X795_9FLAO|nr:MULTISPECIES: TIGR00730 family Rossman fold protein [Antarcticibacterium]QCY70501.1 TIGR00730 family Rossman fold protein [Antarcticibacterium flavum]